MSLGFGCGPEMDDFGKFAVDFAEEELDVVYSVVNGLCTKGYKRNALAGRSLDSRAGSAVRSSPQSGMHRLIILY